MADMTPAERRKERRAINARKDEIRARRDANNQALQERKAAELAARGGLAKDVSGYGDDGAYHLATQVSEGDAKDMAARVTREQFERYMTDFAPVEKELIASRNEAVDPGEAAASAQGDAVRARESLARMRDRYGTTQTAGQAASESRQTTLDTSLAGLGAANTQRQANEDRQFNLTGSLLNLGNNLRSSSMGGLTETATNIQARENSYDQAKSQADAANKQQTASAVATVATIAAMAF